MPIPRQRASPLLYLTSSALDHDRGLFKLTFLVIDLVARFLVTSAGGKVLAERLGRYPTFQGLNEPQE